MSGRREAPDDWRTVSTVVTTVTAIIALVGGLNAAAWVSSGEWVNGVVAIIDLAGATAIFVGGHRLIEKAR
ncbi:membrane protein [Gordonia phage DatBoi]|nr:membrane protein [Gordonia phage DatBoi]